MVVFNASDEPTTQTVAATAGQRYDLHPVQANGSDPVVKTATHNAANRTVHRPSPHGRGLRTAIVAQGGSRCTS